MIDKPCESAARAWTRLMRAHEAALGCVERALKAEGLPPLAWYEVLVELERQADACGVRPYALERALSMPQYGLSRLVARLEDAGLVTRRGCPGDGRGQLVAITDAGRDTLARMRPVHAAALHEALGSRLSPAESAGLAELLGRLVDPCEAEAAAASRDG